MSARPKPPADFDENPPLDADFFRRARPAAHGENARLRAALAQVVRDHDNGLPLDEAIARARAALAD
ncbi:hypothetical protein [Roseicyclus sp.]|uniref:hypothetical protein n=1 Tax=Roseicyclus sp. TaxID=1914329 RepID=UPI003FA01FCA